MGGRVLFALSIAAFPEDLPRDVLAAIFEGASSKVREAGGTLAGGHTIRDPEPKYGLAVDRGGASGQAAAQGRRAARRRAAPDQARSGPGVLVSGRAPGPDERRGPGDGRSTDADAQPSRVGGRSSRAGVRAATDVTGFGLLGHGLEMARASGTRFVFEAAALPALPGALELAAAGVETGGAAHNRRFVAPSLTVARRRARPELVTLAHDPQTSGGLLAAVRTGSSVRGSVVGASSRTCGVAASLARSARGRPREPDSGVSVGRPRPASTGADLDDGRPRARRK